MRTTLTRDEQLAERVIQVELEIRNLPELRRRIERGEVLSRAEMLKTYYPTAETYNAVASHLSGQGLEIRADDLIHLAVYARGTVETMARALNTTFGRVRTGAAEYTAAVAPPSLPEEIAQHVVAIGGLEPYHPATRHVTAATPQGQFLTPQFLREYYQATGFDGRGQTIAVMVAASAVEPSDLTQFWAAFGVPQSLANYTAVDIAWTPTEFLHGDAEGTLDVEWASAMAPAAKIRAYQTIDPRQFAYAILNDLPNNPGLHQASLSVGLVERLYTPNDIVRVQSQYYTALAAEGVTIFASSGDGGSNDGATTAYGGIYDPSVPASVSYPASDPCITAVGGTLLEFDGGGNQVVAESSYASAVAGGVLLKGAEASGGGTSQIFARPSWQTGTGVPSTTARCVPDVSAIWTSNFAPCGIYLRGQFMGVGGTSLSTPIWGGICALLNQARASANLGPVGLLGPRIYPLNGTAAFRDITSGTNGAYQAGTGYDLCTGLGSPNVAKLAEALNADHAVLTPAIPTVTSQPASQSVAPGTAIKLSVVATSDAPISYEWAAADPANQNWGEFASIPWVRLEDGAIYSGTNTATLTILNPTTSLNGYMYMCRVTNSYGVTLTLPAIIAVDAAKPAIAPKVTLPPGFVSVWAGGRATLTPGVSGTGPFTYQWYDLNHVAIAGATSATFVRDPAKPADAGSYAIKVSGPGGSTEGGAFIFVVTNPTLSCPATAAGSIGEAFSFKITAANNSAEANHSDYTTLFDASGLPPGLRVERSTGTISGVPSQAGVYDVLVSASNALGSDALSVKMTITGVESPKVIDGPTARAVSYPAYSLPWLSLHVTATGGGLNYRWQKDGQDIASSAAEFSSPTTDTLGINLNSGTPTNNAAGLYRVVITNSSGTITSSALSVALATAPMIVIQPPHLQTSAVGDAVWISVSASQFLNGAMASLTYQWQHNGVLMQGATESSLYLKNITAEDAGTYKVTVTSPTGSTVSDASLLDVSSPLAITAQPAGGSVLTGTSYTLAISAHGTGNLTYQWSKDGSPLAGATAASYTINSAQPADAGHYTVVVGDATGARLTSDSAEIAVTNTMARLVNIATRAYCSTGNNVTIGGFVVTGNISKRVLIRAIGPTLIEQGIGASEALLDPTIEVHLGAAVVATNDDWGTNANKSEIVDVAKQVGANPIASSDTKSSALLLSLSPGAYTIVAGGKTQTSGIVLLEVYDADTVMSGSRFVNIATRAYAITNNGVAIGGFVITGNVAKKILLRAIGPTLANQGLAGSEVLADPIIELHRGADVIATNDNWSDAPNAVNISSTGVKVGALPIDKNDSRSSALLMDLPPGVYSFVVRGTNSTRGIVLVEIYDAD